MEAELLLAWALDTSRLDVLTHPELPVAVDPGDRYVDGIARRAAREPLAYIRGNQEFYGLDFAVNSNVLIPRPETEMLVDFAIEKACVDDLLLWDVGTGSGCIAAAAAVRVPALRAVASDISTGALNLAGRNLRARSVDDRVQLLRSDLLTAARPHSVTIIVANPPYIATGELAELQPEVRDYEPRLALAAGAEGLCVHRRLVPQAFRALRSGGWLAVETACGQADSVLKLFRDTGFLDAEVRRDLAGIERVVTGRRV